MRSKTTILAALVFAVGVLATPARAETLVKVTVRGPDGGPAAGVAVVVRQAAGYGDGSGGVAGPALVGTATTAGDGIASVRLAGARSYDVYTITADDKANGGHAATAAFAGDSRWPEAALTLGDAVPAIAPERVAAGKAATSCDQAAYTDHFQHVRAAIRQQERTLFVLDNAIAQYARASGFAFPNLDAARAELAVAQQQGSAATDRAATLQHYVLLRVLAENIRTGLEADRVSAESIATLASCSNESKAGVEMLPRCPPGWQLAQQSGQTGAAACHQRTPGSEPSRK